MYRFLIATFVVVGCTSGETNSDDASSTSSTGGSVTTTAQGGSAGSPATGGSSATGGQGGAGANGGNGGNGGDGGTGGAGGTWPTCDTKPASAATKTIVEVWQDDPATPVETWVSGVIVTAISRGGCSANQACQVFLQQDATYADFATGAQHGIKLFASAATSEHFTSVQVGDVVDVLGYAWRYDLDAQNELLLQVNLQLPGCAKTTGTATPTPIPNVTLADLTETAYETTHGPLLVQVSTITGNPNAPTETFGVWPTGNFPPSGPTVSLSPFFLAGAAFSGLTDGVNTDFATATGVFGLFVPPPTGPKFVEIYPRDMAELVAQ